jgi:hypothetical protein
MKDEIVLCLAYKSQHTNKKAIAHIVVLKPEPWEKLCNIGQYNDSEVITLAINLELIDVVHFEYVQEFRNVSLERGDEFETLLRLRAATHGEDNDYYAKRFPEEE